MTDRARLVAAKAISLVGTPFRLHGRSAEFGVDCIGLAILSYEVTGIRAPELPDYGLRNTGLGDLAALAASAGLALCGRAIKPGDLLLVRPGPAQLHALIAIDQDAFVHADASLRRVVRIPGPLSWPIIEHFGLSKEP